MFWGWTIEWDRERRRPTLVRVVWAERRRARPLVVIGLACLGLLVLAVLLTAEPLGGW